MISSKTCKDCGLAKSTSEFYASAEMRDGFENHCKPCKLAQARGRRAAKRGDGGNVARRPRRVSSSTRSKRPDPWGGTPDFDRSIDTSVTVQARSTEFDAALRGAGPRGEDLAALLYGDEQQDFDE